MTEDPHSLTIYSTNSTLDVRGGAGFYGAIVAPDSDVTLVGNTGFFGTVLGGTVDLTGTTDIHVDESLVRELFGIEPFTPLLVE